MNYVLFHIPHSLLKIPKQFWAICIKDKDYISSSNLFMCDFLTDKLVPNKCHKLIFKYSRLFCDVEKFKDDKKEIMFQKGMGVIYTQDCDNIITNPNYEYKNKVLKSYYDKHHNKLDKIVTNIINQNKKCIIIDLHSYSDEMVKKLFNIKNTPDICIGIDNNYTSKELIDFTIKHFKQYNYSIDINNPYVGTIIPNKFINKKEDKLLSIMIEINKRIYLNSKNDFNKLKECLDEYYKKLNYFK
ncbi:MAG: N-formylglutamate amidohydrolase [Bacilli bacterium]|nr:N-formylglutamate amidohydrolase [Bacilli bacterium]